MPVRPRYLLALPIGPHAPLKHERRRAVVQDAYLRAPVTPVVLAVQGVPAPHDHRNGDTIHCARAAVSYCLPAARNTPFRYD